MVHWWRPLRTLSGVSLREREEKKKRKKEKKKKKIEKKWKKMWKIGEFGLVKKFCLLLELHKCVRLVSLSGS